MLYEYQGEKKRSIAKAILGQKNLSLKCFVVEAQHSGQRHGTVLHQFFFFCPTKLHVYRQDTGTDMLSRWQCLLELR